MEIGLDNNNNRNNIEVKQNFVDKVVHIVLKKHF